MAGWDHDEDERLIAWD